MGKLQCRGKKALCETVLTRYKWKHSFKFLIQSIEEGEKERKKKLAAPVICPAEGMNAINYSLLEIDMRIKNNCQIRTTNFRPY